jgi:hypothetical protein
LVLTALAGFIIRELKKGEFDVKYPKKNPASVNCSS